ncbi:MAG: succinylglutamate desuccinylase/aspartoacylase family protein [Solirubrobacterales bacterium]
MRFKDHQVAPGSLVEIRLAASEFYTSDPILVPVTIVRGRRRGPTLFVTAAVHGDELNGVAVIRDLLIDHDFSDLAGTLIAVPVVNVPGFLHQTRMLPDRRDLNRSFPGRPEGSLTARLAHLVHRYILRRSDFGIDLHTAGGEHSNYPQVRADLSSPAVAELARAFGCPLIVDGKGPEGSLRRAALDAGVPTIVYEAGSPRVFERPFIDVGVAGVLSVMRHLRMLPGACHEPPVRIEIAKSSWLRAPEGGMIDLQVALGEPVRRGQLLSIGTNPFGRERSQLRAPTAGIVLGLSRLPLVHPGDAVCHLARLPAETLGEWQRHWRNHPERRS